MIAMEVDALIFEFSQVDVNDSKPSDTRNYYSKLDEQLQKLDLNCNGKC